MTPIRSAFAPICAAICASLYASPLAHAAPPDTPFVSEPELEGQFVNPADIHMESSPFSDPDGDTHLCSDWQIWIAPLSELIWQTTCITGVERVHTHLGDGAFQGSHTGRTELFPETSYTMRLRHKDDSGIPAEQHSGWASRSFVTTPLTLVTPLEITDVSDSVPPTLQDALGVPVVLPSGAPPAEIVLETSTSQILLQIQGLDNTSNLVSNPLALTVHEPAQLRVLAGSVPLSLTETDLSFSTDDGRSITVYIPPMSLTPGESARLWIAEDGATYLASPAQTEPDFSTLARSAPTPWVVRQPGYVVETVATGFQLPVNIAFVPNPGAADHDPAFYVTELYGSIKVVLNDGHVEDFATNLLNFNPTGNFPGSGEQGLTGIVVHPANGDVFAAMLYDAAGAHHPKVVRFTSSDGGVTADSATTILDMFGESQGQSHQISSLSIGPDSKLYVHMGDGFNASTAQNLNSFRGKILRINTDGSAPNDNPFYNPADGITATDYIYAYGLRNPFGGTWRASNNRLYQVENGPSIDRFASVLPAMNYLWDGTNASMLNHAIYNWDPAHAPTNIAFIQPQIFNASGFPATTHDHAFVAESGPTYASGPQARGKRISQFVLDASDNLVSGPTPFVEYAGTGKATIVGLAAGPDGLYFTDLYKDQDASSPIDAGANVLRVRFVGTASFDLVNPAGPAPHQAQFLNTSTVPTPVSYHWAFGDGAESTEFAPTHTYTRPGLYTVRLTVIGPDGAKVAQTPRAVRVEPSRSVAFITGSLQLNANDAAADERMRSFGLNVTNYDDEPANRPSASAIAAAHDLVVISSSVLSSNITDQFDQQPVPVVFWEQAIATPARMGLATTGTTALNSGFFFYVNVTHPITQGNLMGGVGTMIDSATISYISGPLAPGAEPLLYLPSRPNDLALVVIDAGGQLLDGQTAPARRAFIYLEQIVFPLLDSDGLQFFDRTIAWALGVGSPVFTQHPSSTQAFEHQPVSISAAVSSPLPVQLAWTHDSNAIPNSGVPALNITDTHDTDAGEYRLTATNLYGSSLSNPATLTVNACEADLNNDGFIDSGDISMFVSLFLAADPAADLNNDGFIDSGDISDFVAAFLAGC